MPDEIGELHRLLMHPVAVVVPVFRDARRAAAAGAGQHGKSRMLAKKIDQAVSLGSPACNEIV